MKAFFGWLSRYKSIFLLGIAGLLLLAAQSAYWINHTIFDKQDFTSIVTETLQTEESRQAIASTIVDEALAERPILRRTVSSQATQLITGLLGTDLATQTFGTIIDRGYDYLTSSDPQPIVIDLLAIKTPIAGLVSFAESQGRDVSFDPDVIPDTIVLFSPENLPEIHRYSTLMLWLGPLFWMGSLGLFAGYIYRGRRVYAKRVYIVGAVIIGISVIGLLTGPALPPPIAASTPIASLRGVVSDLVEGLLRPFLQQMVFTIAITLSALIVFSQRFNILKLIQKFAPAKK